MRQGAGPRLRRRAPIGPALGPRCHYKLCFIKLQGGILSKTGGEVGCGAFRYRLSLFSGEATSNRVLGWRGSLPPQAIWATEARIHSVGVGQNLASKLTDRRDMRIQVQTSCPAVQPLLVSFFAQPTKWVCCLCGYPFCRVCSKGNGVP